MMTAPIPALSTLPAFAVPREQASALLLAKLSPRSGLQTAGVGS
jgi:hypothetical protein